MELVIAYFHQTLVEALNMGILCVCVCMRCLSVSRVIDAPLPVSCVGI